MNRFQAALEKVVGYEIDWSSTAAWVQAFGALLALYIAIEIPRRAQRQQRQAFRQTVLTYAHAIAEGVRVAAIYSGDDCERISSEEADSASMELHLRSLIASVERLNLAQLEDDVALDATLRLIGAAETVVASPTASNLTIDQAAQLLEGISTAQRARRRVFEQLARLEHALSK